MTDSVATTCLVCGQLLDPPPSGPYPTREEYERETTPPMAMLRAMEVMEVHAGHESQPPPAATGGEATPRPARHQEQPEDTTTTEGSATVWRRVADDPLPFLVALMVVLAAALTVVSIHVIG